MPIPEANINNTGSLAKMFDSIKTAGVPDRVTTEFLKTIGLKSSNDRPIIPVLKGIGFLDANGKPTELYKAYRSHDGGKVLASALHNAYSDIFLANTKAQGLSLDKLKGIIASKTTKGDAIVERIARTFQALAKSADWSEATEVPEISVEPEQKELERPCNTSTTANLAKTPSFHYNLEIHLPTTTDITVYNAIFKSLKENLL